MQVHVHVHEHVSDNVTPLVQLVDMYMLLVNCRGTVGARPLAFIPTLLIFLFSGVYNRDEKWLNLVSFNRWGLEFIFSFPPSR